MNASFADVYYHMHSCAPIIGGRQGLFDGLPHNRVDRSCPTPWPTVDPFSRIPANTARTRSPRTSRVSCREAASLEEVLGQALGRGIYSVHLEAAIARQREGAAIGRKDGSRSRHLGSALGPLPTRRDVPRPDDSVSLFCVIVVRPPSGVSPTATTLAS